MKLYAQVNRVYRDLEALGIGATDPLTVEQLAPFDNYHYHGSAAVDNAIRFLGIDSTSRVLDIGGGIGGPARYVAARTGAHVTSLELQPDLNDVAIDLTARCGLSALVAHRVADALAGLDDEPFDAIMSFLCFLHIAERPRLLAVCHDALKPAGRMYVEDYAVHRAATATEAEQLRVKVQCPGPPTIEGYRSELQDAGFDAHIDDVTESWSEFTTSRLALYRASRQRNIDVHGTELVDGLDDFYATVNNLFLTGLIAGVTITARHIPVPCLGAV